MLFFVILSQVYCHGRKHLAKPQHQINFQKSFDMKYLLSHPLSLHTQAQGRLEDQRSRAPGPMDDEDFFSLLLRVQGGRMDEQRTELPRMLQT